MVENAGDGPVDRKPSVVDSFVEIKPPKLEAPIKVETSMKVEASSVNSDVSKFRDN